jgi:RNA polymerase sigma factor (sigma-70 family)
MMEDGPPAGFARDSQFALTRWSLIAAAGDPDAAQTRQALGDLCKAYWYPLYAYLRRARHAEADAGDLLQEFFLNLFEADGLRAADRSRGRFRSFILASLKHHVANEQRRDRAQKRGGHRQVVSFDVSDAESRYAKEAVEPADSLTPEALYDRQWAVALLDQVMSKLRCAHVAAGKTDLFDALAARLAGEGEADYAAIGVRLGMTEGAVKVAAHRLRTRWREAVRAEIAETLAEGESVDDELCNLFNAFSS